MPISLMSARLFENAFRTGDFTGWPDWIMMDDGAFTTSLMLSVVGTERNCYSVVVKTAEVASLVRTVQFAFHILQQRRRRLGRERGYHVPGQLLHLGGENESDIHILLIPFFGPAAFRAAGRAEGGPPHVSAPALTKSLCQPTGKMSIAFSVHNA